MEIIADLHVHSRYSIATGKEADLEHLDLWGRYKGLRVVGAGDCTHPGWLQELSGKLEEVAEGVYELKQESALPLGVNGASWEAVPPVRFIITGEISTIYKKGGQTRKVHLLILLPGLEAAHKLSARLGRLGNVASDGRPILGLDARYLLELVLEIDPEAMVIPAHIWTPWFSVLGSKSGFNALEECFEDRVSHIFALETGLSSDPAMNWRVSALDRYLLVSNSDAHSPQKLGREANIFLVPPTYPALAQALRSKEGFWGTIEFFPQEGKYHLDGHRQCSLRLSPEEAEELAGRCPQCGRGLTYGVMHRVLDLADRPDGISSPEAKPYVSLIALPEVLGEVLEVNAGSKKVRERYFRLLTKLGPELEILRRAPLNALAREGGPLLAYGIDKMRRGEVHIAPGYDGAYGEIRLFTQEERRRLQGQGAFFSAPGAAPGSSIREDLRPETSNSLISPVNEIEPTPVLESEKPQDESLASGDPLLAGLNRAQCETVLHRGAPLLVQAGPGTGKTRALTYRLAYLLARRGVAPEEILALTFTRQAAGEMGNRLRQLVPDFPGLEKVTIKTFHSLGYQILLERGDSSRAVADEERRRGMVRRVAREHDLPFASLERQITAWKQALKYPGDLPAGAAPSYLEAFRAYEAVLSREALWDYEDLIARPVVLLNGEREMREAYRARFRHLLVDEYQDLNEAQYRFFRHLAGPHTEIMVIGDPDQAIYGFRGASPVYFRRFLEDFPGALACRFNETYRLPPPVLQAARQLREAGGAAPERMATHRAGDLPVVLLEEASEAAEARAIAREIEKLVGGLSHLALEDDRVRHQGPEEKAGFREIAVLYRVHALGAGLERGLAEAGIPCQQAREGVGPEWDDLDLAAEKVKLLTLHAAKGLEFPYVFIAGCETGLIPWEPQGEGEADLAEEGRLFYVGLTRASRQVFLTRARTRFFRGRKRQSLLSPLAREIPWETPGRPAFPAPAKRCQPQLFPELKPKPKRMR